VEHCNSAASSCEPTDGTGRVDGALMPLRLEFTLPPQIALDLDLAKGPRGSAQRRFRDRRTDDPSKVGCGW